MISQKMKTCSRGAMLVMGLWMSVCMAMMPTVLRAQTKQHKQLAKEMRKQLVQISNGRDSLSPGTAVWMSKYEITVAQFDAFVRATGYVTDAERKKSTMVLTTGMKPTEADVTYLTDHFGQPWSPDLRHRYAVMHVSKNDALAFCRWLSGLMKMEVSLPSEREWEYAATGGIDSDRMIPGTLSSSGSGRNPKPIGSAAPNPRGICDMEGSLSEWIEDEDKTNPFEAMGVAPNPAIGVCRLKGAYWLEGPLSLSFVRLGFRSDYSSFEAGFRIVVRKPLKGK